MTHAGNTVADWPRSAAEFAPHRSSALVDVQWSDFAAVVFCGRATLLIDLAGEPTALVPYRFVLPEPSLAADHDFARRAAPHLPGWPADRVEPLEGVCFAFTERASPHVRRLQQAGAVSGTHHVIVDSDYGRAAVLDDQVRSVLAVADPDRQILVLGFGQQGHAIACRLREHFAIEARRVTVFDDDRSSRDRAVECGFAVAQSTAGMSRAGCVIYSPLKRYDRLFDLFEQMRQAGTPGLDNSRPPTHRRQFRQVGRHLLTAAAASALRLEGDVIRPKPHGLSLTCAIVREEVRLLDEWRIPHLRSGQQCVVNAGSGLDLAAPDVADGLARSTFGGLNRAYISLHDRADVGFFAARALCARLWPHATSAVFPSAHVNDLGATEFERLLLAHLEGREIATPQQTPAQRVALGAAARHYASTRPILEIGSALGGSALLFAAATAMMRPPIYSIDPDFAQRDVVRFLFQHHGHLDRLRQLTLTSDQAIGQLGDLREGCGLVFIDGLHTSKGVASDFRNYAPLVAVGGALLFHDVAPNMYSVMSAVSEQALNDVRFSAKCLIDGLLVLERTKP